MFKLNSTNRFSLVPFDLNQLTEPEKDKLELKSFIVFKTELLMNQFRSN